jgi:hypothetical protein
MKEHHVSIWFLIGLQFTIYGVLILGAGVYEWLNPAAPGAQLVLAELHAGVWLGIIMLLMGIFYTWKLWPKKG